MIPTRLLALWSRFDHWRYRTFTVERYEDGSKMRKGDRVVDRDLGSGTLLANHIDHCGQVPVAFDKRTVYVAPEGLERAE